MLKCYVTVHEKVPNFAGTYLIWIDEKKLKPRSSLAPNFKVTSEQTETAQNYHVNVWPQT